MGWHSIGSETELYGTRDTDAVQHAHVTLQKTVKVAGMQIELYLDVPFSATVTFDPPVTPCVYEDTEPLPERKWKESR